MSEAVKIFLAAMACFSVASTSLLAQGTAFTYQGRLNSNGVAAGGSFDFSFALFSAGSGGGQLGNTATNTGVPVTNGLFTVSLDFGNQFPGASRWLEIGVRPNGGGAFTTLSPRQAVTPAPYAVTAGNVTGLVAASQVSGTIPLAQLPSAVMTNGASGLNLSGTFNGNGAGVTNVTSAIQSFRGIGTNTIFVDQSAPGSYLIFTNRAFYINSNLPQTNSPSLYLVVTNQTLIQDIGFLDGRFVNNGSLGSFAGLEWFPNHSGSEPEMTIDSPGSMALGWNIGSRIGISLQPNRSLQIGIFPTEYGRLDNIYLEGCFNSVALPNCGYAIPFIFNSGYKTNGVNINQNLTLWAHATDTNGESRLTLFDNWDMSATPDLSSHNFANSKVRAEFITASSHGPGGVSFNGIVTSTNFQGAFTGDGSGLINLNFSSATGAISLAQLPPAVVTNGASGVIISGAFSGNGANLTGVQAANTLQNTSEAIAFANANNISDLATRAALVGMENELKTFNVWSNVTDIFPLYARFHPLSGNTFLGRTFTNRDFTVGSFGVSTWPSPIKVAIPSQTNGTVVVVWQYPLSTPYLFELHPVAGLANETTHDEFLYSAYLNAYERMLSVTNSVLQSTYVNDQAWPAYGVFGWNPDSANGTSQFNLQQRVDFASFNTNGNLQFYRNGMRGMVGGGTPDFTNHVGFRNAFNEIVIGGDPLGVTTSPCLASIAAVFVLNTEINSNLAFAVTRAARWLDPRRKNLILVGDSLTVPNYTNSFDYYLSQNPRFSDYFFYNLAGSGQSAVTCDTITGSGGIGRITNVLNMLSGLGCVSESELVYCLGLNDLGIQGSSPSNTWYHITNFTSAVPLDMNVRVGTIAAVSTNETLFNSFGTTALGINSNAAVLNGIVLSNSYRFGGGVFDKASLFNQSNLATNAGFTTDGIHLNDTNGHQLQIQIAALIANNNQGGSPGGTSGGLTTNVTNGTSTFYITNGLIMRITTP